MAPGPHNTEQKNERCPDREHRPSGTKRRAGLRPRAQSQFPGEREDPVRQLQIEYLLVVPLEHCSKESGSGAAVERRALPSVWTYDHGAPHSARKQPSCGSPSSDFVALSRSWGGTNGMKERLHLGSATPPVISAASVRVTSGPPAVTRPGIRLGGRSPDQRSHLGHRGRS